MAGKRDYEEEKNKIRDFLDTFYIEDENDEEIGRKVFPYANQILRIAQREQVVLYIDLGHVTTYDPELADSIRENAKRYATLFADLVEELISQALAGTEPPVKDALDAFIYQRMLMFREQREQAGDDALDKLDVRKLYPPELMRRFEVYFKPTENCQTLSVRQVGAEKIGKLITLRGIVIRSTEVKPMAAVITYTCDTCGSETYQPVSGPSFTPAVTCPSRDCKESRANGRLQMQVRGSKFVKFQEIKVQEHSDQVPVGSVPRSLTVYVRGENTRLAAPGNHVKITGVFLPQLRAGFRQMVQGLLSEVFVEAHHIETYNQSEEEDLLGSEELSEEDLAAVTDPNFYPRMAESIAPEIYGHEDVKKCLLLQLVGGVDKNAGGMKIRGAVNICLMGDPGVAKSQLLAHLDRLAPRSQYTTGRGSSGVGLTAAVMKDPLTGEWTLEGGALVLADRGICCIDEFDKMMEADRTAIHEVMEQQSISVAKAGIMTTLNARVSILAAANPAFGRYNPNRSIEHNIQLPAALLSRFDLLWLIRDKPSREQDLELARHITYVHANSKQPRKKGAREPLDMKLIRRYVALCKRKNPVVPEECTERLVTGYVELRKDARNNSNTTFTSPRNLLAIIRLSTALARLRLADTVIMEDIEEAQRLMEQSKVSLYAEEKAKEKKQNPVDRAFYFLREMMHNLPKGSAHEIDFNEAHRKCVQKGLNDQVFEDCISKYSDMGVLMANRNRTKIIFTMTEA